MTAHPDEVDLVIRDGLVLPLDDRTGFRGDVAVDGGRIVELGPRVASRGTEELDAAQCAVLPGLINAHSHECMERGWFEDLPFDTWLRDHAQPKDQAYTPADQQAAALLNQLEMIRSGITTFVDMFRYPQEAAGIAERSGLRAVIAPQLIDSPPGVGETLEATIEAFEEWHGAGDGRISVWFGPHAVYSCDDRTLSTVAEEARSRGTRIHTHLAESCWEDANVRDRTGVSPTVYLDQVMGLGPDVLVAHGVHLADPDLELLAERGTAVAHCPTSNMKLGNGVAPVPRMLASGLVVALGTDSVMTNNNLDLFEEMRQAALVAKLAAEDPAVLPAWTVLEMATSLGAEALGLGAEIGTLEVGKRADLVLVDLDRPHLWPLHVSDTGLGNLVEQLVYSARAGDVVATVVEGRVLMDDGVVRTLDHAEIREVVQRQAHDLLGRAGAASTVIDRLGARRFDT